MKIEVDSADLKPVIAAAVAEAMAAASTLGTDRLGYSEAEAARSLGMPKHRLRDARLRGEITGRRVGKAVYYARDELVRFLAKGDG